MSTPDEVSGRYKLDRRLGAGGMSTVFLAMDTVLERQVAVKLLAEHLAEDETFVARFRNEALAAARLQHPNVVQVFDSGLDQPSDRHFIVMEFVEGPSCADLLRERKQLDIEEAVAYVRDACQGLDYAHRAGVVHRDVKPGNLLMASDNGIVKLADFGIAKAAEQTRITQVGSVLGTAAYLSPEQARGEEAGPPSDIYSLGVCAYQFLAGRLPHEYASLTELALKQQQEPIEPIAVHRPDVPPELDKAVRLCLEPDVSSRYSDALELADALAAGLHGQDTEVTRALERSTQLMAGEDATSVLPADATASTRAQRRDRTRVAPVPVPAPDRTRASAARTGDAATANKKGRKRLGNLLVVLLILAAGVAAALAVISAGGGGGEGGGPDPIDEADVQAQVQALEDLISENTR